MAARQLDQLRLGHLGQKAQVVAAFKRADEAQLTQFVYAVIDPAQLAIAQVIGGKDRLLAVDHADIEALGGVAQAAVVGHEAAFVPAQNLAIDVLDEGHHL